MAVGIVDSTMTPVDGWICTCVSTSLGGGAEGMVSGGGIHMVGGFCETDCGPDGDARGDIVELSDWWLTTGCIALCW